MGSGRTLVAKTDSAFTLPAAVGHGMSLLTATS